ncbi:serine/threonine-protein kinase STY46 [Elaeis guineensis]|uniref:serine/threonine-protein kinase STY46 n=1 Tax=Elaeis guineensis var. tenera TaxID=51953 RepID=UPI003C6D5681
MLISVLSETQQPSKASLQQQVGELREELQRQRELKDTYKARMERMQDYVRFCLDIAQQNGFLHHISNNQQPPHPTEFNHETTSKPVDRMTGDPQLAGIRDQAKINGWFIEPHEKIEFNEKIGQGTTADIYRATWRGLDVAVKCIYPTYFQLNESGEEFFAYELDTLSRQRHPYVLRLMGACLLPPENGWVVTELLSGKTLTEWLHGHKERQRERSIPLPPLKERLKKALEVAQAVQYLHEQKPMVIHRDLKPSNVLLDDCSHVRVADFGHARFLPEGEAALTGEIGTYVYMAPEIIRCEPYNEKCDVYSFGIILNELITGQHPYIETSFKPRKIALEVGEGRLRPALPDDDGQYKELIDLICCSWSEDASTRPSFAIIASTLRKIQEKFN